MKLLVSVSLGLFSHIVLSTKVVAQNSSVDIGYREEGTDHWYETHGPWAFLLVMIWFFVPCLIAARNKSDDIGETYWKWWFIFLGGFGLLLLMDRFQPASAVALYLAIAVYGLFIHKEKKTDDK
jgi:hypothetical protein